MVEDVSVIAMSLADALRDEGFEIVGPVGSQRRALALLDVAGVDAVVLELTLEDGLCTGLAATLRGRGAIRHLLRLSSRQRGQA